MSATHAMAGAYDDTFLLGDPVDTYIEEATYTDARKEEEDPRYQWGHYHYKFGLLCPLTSYLEISTDCNGILFMLSSSCCLTFIGNLCSFPVLICSGKLFTNF